MYVYYDKKDIITVTERSLLVRMDGMRYSVWLPKKLTKRNINNNEYKTFLPEKFKFTVMCEDEKYKFTAEEVSSAFNGVLPTNFRGDKSFYHMPKIIAPKKVKVIDSLKR